MGTIATYAGKLNALSLYAEATATSHYRPTAIPSGSPDDFYHPFSVDGFPSYQVYDANDYSLYEYIECYRLKDYGSNEVILGAYIHYDNGFTKHIRPAYKYNGAWRTDGAYSYSSKYGAWIPAIFRRGTGDLRCIFMWVKENYATASNPAKCTREEFVSAIQQSIASAKQSENVDSFRFVGTSPVTGQNYSVSFSPDVGYNPVYYGPGWLNFDENLETIDDATLNLAPTIFYYDGEEHLPAASLVDRNGILLLNGTDYTVSYSPDNINVGEKIALAIGIGQYTGEVQANWWIVNDNDIAGYTLNIVPKQIKFTGSSVEPLVTLYDRSGNLLTPNIDYTLTLGPDTVTVGEKYARCDGIGNYTGTIQGTWAIVDNINDPYSPGGTTVPSTGPTDGTWELPDDDLAIPGSLWNDLATQLYRPYAMTSAQLASFSNQLWNTDVLDIISRYFEKPTEVVISLMSFPFTVECENSEQINFNWISSWSSVYVLGHPITKEIQTLDFGYLDLDRYSGLFYDYQPYSSVQLYLPYIGFVPLKMNEVVGKRILLSYKVDVLSGDFTAIVETGDMIHPEDPERTLPIIGFYQGNIARPMPLSQQDLFSLFKKGTEIAITGAVAATAGTVGAIEGLAAEKAVGEAVQFTEQGLPQAAEMAMGRSATSQAQSQSAYKTFRRFGAATAANSILSIGNASAPILRNGTIDGISGRTSGQEAFIVITVPNQNVPENQRILGYPTNQPGPLSKFSGYTEVRDIRLKIPNATESEIAEIESIVRGGIVI